MVRTVFKDSCSLVYTHTGYNVLYGHQHVKSYHSHDGICATVIRNLRSNMHGSFIDPNIEDMVYVISTS